jgi:tyrosine-protein kinase Etk/Wzc
MENNQLSDKILKQINSGIDLKRLMGAILTKWYWFLLSVATFFTAGFLYIRYTTPEYLIKSTILIEDQQKNPATSLLNKMNEGSGSSAGQNPNLFNEMFVLKSQDLVQMAIDSLDMNIQYWTQGRVKEDELYKTCPIRIVFDSTGYLGANTQEIRLKQVVDGLFEFREARITDRVLYDSWIKRPYGRFKIQYVKGPYINLGYLANNTEIIVRIDPPTKTNSKVLNAFKVAVSDGRTSLLDLTYTDNLPPRGVEFINALIYL